jgi:hypothetical protein
MTCSSLNDVNEFGGCLVSFFNMVTVDKEEEGKFFMSKCT